MQQGIITIYQTVPPILQTRLSLYGRLFDSDAVFTDNVRKIVRSLPDGCRVVIRVNADHSPDKFRIDINAHFPRAAVQHHKGLTEPGVSPRISRSSSGDANESGRSPCLLRLYIHPLNSVLPSFDRLYQRKITVCKERLTDR